jgi:hypothetical protein
MWADAGVHKDVRLFSRPVVLKPWRRDPGPSQNAVKGCCIRLHAPPTSHMPHPLHRGIRPPYPKWVTRLSWAYQCLGFEGETCHSGQSCLEQPKRVMKQHKGWPADDASREPSRGQHPQASYLSPDREISFMPLRVGWHQAVRVFPPGITRERHMKPPGPDLIGGHWSLSSPMESHLPWLALTHER